MRVRELKRMLLPSKFDPTGSYKDPLRVTTRALSFRVLTHAEVETYFEDRVLEVAATALDAWETNKFVSVVTFHLIGFGGRSTDRPPETLHAIEQNKLKEWPSKTSIDDRFSKCVSEFHKRIKFENHGVKERNIMEMFVPIGFYMGRCDPIFLQTMNNFGEARGAVAHTSGKGHVQKAVDPKDEYTTLQKIIASLETIDAEFDRLLRASKAPK
ncbi:hypothetical protein ABID19_000068 [Mesorhizobium robiniae]|uniref:RiboL-PSP-HEPN domain-containing protein n=1 Tax=Mesorhizobium robiniae TaxID=559315 RepID=A0ABV2GFK7_9HYPH